MEENFNQQSASQQAAGAQNIPAGGQPAETQQAAADLGEPLYTFTFTPDKNWAKEAYGLMQGRRTAAWVFATIIAALIALIAAISFRNDGITVHTLIVGGLFYLLWIIAFIMERIMIRKTEKGSASAGTVTYTFYQDMMVTKNNLMENRLRYELFLSIEETSGMIGFFQDKRRFLALPKSAVGDQAESLKGFLSAKTGKTIRRVKRKGHLHEILCIAIGTLLFIGVFAVQAIMGNLPVTHTSSDAGYSITTGQGMVEMELDGYCLHGYSTHYYASAFMDSLSYYGYIDGLEYLEDLLAYYEVDQADYRLVHVNDNTVAACYSQNGYFYVTAVTANGDTVALTDFCTTVGNRFLYEPIFLKWVGTVTVKAAADGI